MKQPNTVQSLIIFMLMVLMLLSKPTISVNMQQFLQSLDMMRNGCAPKFKVPLDILDRIREGDFDLEPTQDLLCYTKCIAQLAGTVTKKGEFSVPKAFAQMPIILPPELQEPAKTALNHCKDAQKAYKDSCEKVYYTSKCIADFDRANFKFP
ncbi:Odorant-binding protein 76a [Drosophila willistoni]|uniref:Odorant-binding protein 76a n=1 Tax=Drosophila willistoni TaxID=7260 RepID=B4MXM3_DROWI|nr:general odorant-binding protein lush [Drosophila willistoni]EDW76792.1 Odorant-binding protein 76a [Drosophila willistoni]